MNHLRAIIVLLGLFAAPLDQQRLPPSNSIKGRVVSEDGLPLADAQVNVFHSAGPIPSLTTGEDGSFSAAYYTLLPTSGAFTIEVIAPGYVQTPESKAQRFYSPSDNLTITIAKGGVITGRVTHASGEPVIGVRVRAVPARAMSALQPQTSRLFAARLGWERLTDERGVYRLFGLEPGAYLIVANGQTGEASDSALVFSHDAPVYHPLSTPATAQPIKINVGEEASGIDIRYRSQPGHAITGRIALPTASSNPENSKVSIALTDATSGMLAALIPEYTPRAEAADFSFDQVVDGEYELMAWGIYYHSVSAPLRVTMKGADITGLRLKLAPLGSLTGRVILEVASPADRSLTCAGQRRPSLEEITLIARRDELLRDDSPLTRPQEDSEAAASPDTPSHAAPGKEAYFTLRPLAPGQYRLLMRWPSEDWYARAITLPAIAPDQRLRDVARDGFTLSPGEHVGDLKVSHSANESGLQSQVIAAEGVLTVTIAHGAASLRGRISAVNEAVKLPAQMRVHLIPAEREQADNLLRYAETSARGDGGFTFANLAPGKYWLLARAVSEEEAHQTTPRLTAWDRDERAKLRREAEAMKVEIELQPCQRVSDYALRYAPPGKRDFQLPSRLARPTLFNLRELQTTDAWLSLGWLRILR